MEGEVGVWDVVLSRKVDYLAWDELYTGFGFQSKEKSEGHLNALWISGYNLSLHI